MANYARSMKEGGRGDGPGVDGGKGRSCPLEGPANLKLASCGQIQVLFALPGGLRPGRRRQATQKRKLVSVASKTSD